MDSLEDHSSLTISRMLRRRSTLLASRSHLAKGCRLAPLDFIVHSHVPLRHVISQLCSSRMLTVAESRASFLAAASRAKASSGCMLGGGNLSGASAANDGGGTLRQHANGGFATHPNATHSKPTPTSTTPHTPSHTKAPPPKTHTPTNTTRNPHMNTKGVSGGET